MDFFGQLVKNVDILPEIKIMNKIIKPFIICVGIAIIILIGYAAWNHPNTNSNQTVNPFLHPEIAAAQAAQRNVDNQARMVEALEEQNRLMKEMMQKNK